MKKSNNKGFMLVETLIVATLIIAILIYLFVQFQVIMRSYNSSFTYNTVDAVYGVSNIRSYLESDGLTELITYYEGTTNNSSYIDITNCSNSYFDEENYCLTLLDQLNVKEIIFTSSDLTELKDNDQELNEKLKNFIGYLKYEAGDVNYRLIVEYENGTFGSLEVSE